MRGFMNKKDYKTTCTVPEPVEGTTVGASTSSATEGKTTRLLTFVFCLLSLAFVVSSCSTGKDISRFNIKSMSTNNLIREIEDNQFEFDNLEAKIGVNLKGNNSMGLKGQIRMHNDSVIWISLSLKVGIEIGRIMITPDSVKYINRSTKTYLAESIDYFNEYLPIVPSIQFLQDMLLGNDTQIKRREKYKSYIDDKRYKLEAKNDFIDKNIWILPESFKIGEFNIKDNRANSGELTLKYENFQNVDGRLLPTKIVFDVDNNLGKHDDKSIIHIEINYSDIKKNEKLEFPFNISPKFEQILIW